MCGGDTHVDLRGAGADALNAQARDAARKYMMCMLPPRPDRVSAPHERGHSKYLPRAKRKCGGAVNSIATEGFS